MITLIDLFNKFHDACRRVQLTSDARSLFLAFLQHWNQQRRPQALDITVQALRDTASLDEESYRRAAISLSNLKFWRMKRKAHNKDGRFIYIGDFFLDENLDRREVAAKSPPPYTTSVPSATVEKAPIQGLSTPDKKTDQSAREAEAEKPAENGGFSSTQITEQKLETIEDFTAMFMQMSPDQVVDYFVSRNYHVPQKAAVWLQNFAPPQIYLAVVEGMKI